MTRSVFFLVMALMLSPLVHGCQKGRGLEDQLPREIDRELARAASRGDVAAMDAAVKKGADPNASSPRGMCILDITYSYRNKRGFEHLLELKADPHHADDNGSRVIHLVALNPVESDWIEMVLEHGGDPNILEPVGDQIYNSPDTPIFSACSVGNLESVKTLVKHGANIHVIGTRGRNVVGWSASHGSPIVTQWLLENGADWTVQDVEGTAVAEAELHREFDPTEEPEKAAAHEWILKFLAEKGVDLKAAEEKSRAIYLKNFRPREAAKQAKKP